MKTLDRALGIRLNGAQALVIFTSSRFWARTSISSLGSDPALIVILFLDHLGGNPIKI